jgi:hypothetical protein
MPSGPLPQERQPSVQAVQVAFGPFANLSSRGLASTLDAGAPKLSVLESLETRGRSAANVSLVRSGRPRRPINASAPTMAAVLLKRDTNFLRIAIIDYVKQSSHAPQANKVRKITESEAYVGSRICQDESKVVCFRQKVVCFRQKGWITVARTWRRPCPAGRNFFADEGLLKLTVVKITRSTTSGSAFRRPR